MVHAGRTTAALHIDADVHATCLPACLQSNPLMAKTFLMSDGKGGWRAPKVGELCCQRPVLADTLMNS